MADSVRVLGRTLTRAKNLLAAGTELGKETFRNRHRSARRAARKIARLSRRGREQLKPHYQRLTQVTRATIRQAEQVLAEMEDQAVEQGQHLVETLQTFIPRARQVLNQTVRRVFAGEKVPAAEKLVSIFEPHTDIIRRGKPNKETEFGHMVWFGEVEGGFIAQYRVLEGNPADSDLALPMLDRQKELYGSYPLKASFDGGFASKQNLAEAKLRKIKDVCFAKKRGLSETDMCRSQYVYRRLRRFRAGIESGISWLKRCLGFARCTWRGRDSFKSYVWSSIVAANLLTMARARPAS